jgi:hypothetical protein
MRPEGSCRERQEAAIITIINMLYSYVPNAEFCNLVIIRGKDEKSVKGYAKRWKVRPVISIFKGDSLLR